MQIRPILINDISCNFIISFISMSTYLTRVIVFALLNYRYAKIDVKTDI